jgi:hypothetical protein
MAERGKGDGGWMKPGNSGWKKPVAAGWTKLVFAKSANGELAGESLPDRGGT